MGETRSAQWSTLLAAIADAADAIAMRHFRGGALEVKWKPDGSPTTGADLEIEQAARRARRSRGFGDFYQDVLVAEGAGEIAVDFDLEPWDIAALAILVEEAGGRATSAQGERSIHAGSFVTSNGLLHDAVIQALAGGDARASPE